MKASTLRTLTVLAAACSSVLLFACAAPLDAHQRLEPAPARTLQVEHGVVRSIEVVEAAAAPTGGGALVGGVIGGLLGNQIGDGGGRAAATVAGALGGAFLGNHVEKRQNDANAARVYRVLVRFDNGVTQTFNFRELDGLRVGDRVHYQNGVLSRG